MDLCKHCGLPLPDTGRCSCPRSVLAALELPALEPTLSAFEEMTKASVAAHLDPIPTIDASILDVARSLPSDYISRAELPSLAGSLTEPKTFDQMAALETGLAVWQKTAEAHARSAREASEAVASAVERAAGNERLFDTVPDHYRQVFESLQETALLSYRQVFEPWQEAALIAPLAPFRSGFGEYASLLARESELWRPLQESADLRFAMASLSSLRNAIDFGPFSDGTIAAIRDQLGDWSAPRAIDLTLDAVERLERYYQLGLEPRLVQSPPTVFGKVLRATGIREERPRTSDRRYLLLPEPGEGDEAVDEEAMTDAAKRLWAIESRVRAFLDRIMTTAHGAGWFRSRTPPDVLASARDRRKQRLAVSRIPNDSLLLFVDLGDLPKIICRGDNWPLFAAHFGRKEAVQESFARLNPLRADIAHSRTLSSADLLFLYAEILRIDQAIDRDSRERRAEDDEDDP